MALGSLHLSATEHHIFNYCLEISPHPTALSPFLLRSRLALAAVQVDYGYFSSRLCLCRTAICCVRSCPHTLVLTLGLYLAYGAACINTPHPTDLVCDVAPSFNFILLLVLGHFKSSWVGGSSRSHEEEALKVVAMGKEESFGFPSTNTGEESNMANPLIL